MAQHTSGPWVASGNGVHRGTTCVATTHMEPREQRVADAVLIAAAPELLKQLKGLLGFVNFVIEEIDIDAETTEVVLRLDGKAVATVPLSVVLENSKAAIAKAEGN